MSDDDIENDFDDDFDGDLSFDDDGFDDLNSQKGTLGDLWRNNPLVKIGTILLGVAFLVAGIMIFTGDKDRPDNSLVSSSSDITEAPGSAEVTETFRQAVEEDNARRLEEDIRRNDSSLPMPIDPPKGSLPVQFEEPEEEDPLERWRRLQEERIKQQQVQQESVIPVEEPDTAPAVNAMAQAMSQQMQLILNNQTPKAPIVQQVTPVGYLERLEEEKRRKQEEFLRRQSELVGDIQAEEDALNILVPAGTIEYAQLMTEANSDVPGPILAQVVTGPMKGARLIGNFTTAYNYLTLRFNTAVIDGVGYNINAIAIDPDTTLPGVITEIDRRYMKRVLLPAASEFITGFTEAIANSGRTTVVVSGDSTTTTTSNDDLDNDQEVATGISAAGEEIGEILDEIADNTPVLYRVAAGTPLGILFISSVRGTPKVIEDEREQERLENRLLLNSQFNNNQYNSQGQTGLTGTGLNNLLSTQ